MSFTNVFQVFNIEFLIRIISIIGDVCLFFIAVYTFRLTIFPKKLKLINMKHSFNAFLGDDIEATFENRSLCPVVIKSVDMVIDSNIIRFYDGEPCIVEAFKTVVLKCEAYTNIISQINHKDIDIHSSRKIYFIVETSRGNQYIKHVRVSRIKHYIAKMKEAKLVHAIVCRNECDGTVVSKGVKYVVSFIDERGEEQNVFILSSGYMSKNLFGYNVLAKDIVIDKSKVLEHFESEFAKYNIKFVLKTLE